MAKLLPFQATKSCRLLWLRPLPFVSNHYIAELLVKRCCAFQPLVNTCFGERCTAALVMENQQPIMIFCQGWMQLLVWTGMASMHSLSCLPVLPSKSSCDPLPVSCSLEQGKRDGPAYPLPMPATWPISYLSVAHTLDSVAANCVASDWIIFQRNGLVFHSLERLKCEVSAHETNFHFSQSVKAEVWDYHEGDGELKVYVWRNMFSMEKKKSHFKTLEKYWECYWYMEKRYIKIQRLEDPLCILCSKNWKLLLKLI